MRFTFAILRFFLFEKTRNLYGKPTILNGHTEWTKPISRLSSERNRARLLVRCGILLWMVATMVGYLFGWLTWSDPFTGYLVQRRNAERIYILIIKPMLIDCGRWSREWGARDGEDDNQYICCGWAIALADDVDGKRWTTSSVYIHICVARVATQHVT